MTPNPIGRPKAVLVLTDDEREVLIRYTRRATIPQRIALRARIVLNCAEGFTNQQVAAGMGLNGDTVGKWRARFAADRLEGLLDEPRPGAPRTIGDDDVERVVVKTLETMPKNATQWSTREMARNVGLSPSAIGRIWRTFGLKPHQSETFVLSKDPQLIEKVRDICGLYLNPPDRALVLCVDEKSQIQALNRTQPLIPMTPYQVESRTHDYERHGTTTLFAALDVATGKVIGKCFSRHRAKEFLAFLKQVNAEVPLGQDIHVILDNYATHKTPGVRRWQVKNPRFHFHFTPTKGSWLNLVERWFGLLTQRKIKRGTHTSTQALVQAINDYLSASNEDPKPFVWTKTADEILGKIRRFCERTGVAHQIPPTIPTDL